MKHGFTLAEVLITLSIIGIVAIMTIPNLVSQYQDKMLSTRKKVFHEKILSVLQVMNSMDELAGYSSTQDFLAALSKHIKIIKICEEDKIYECFYTSPEPFNGTLTLMSYDSSQKVATIKLIREITGLTLKDAKELVESSSSAPVTVLADISADEFDDYRKQFEEIGAIIQGAVKDSMQKLISEKLNRMKWGTDLLGVQFIDGTTGIVIYNPNCKSNRYNNSRNFVQCISMYYDINGKNSPNVSSKDIHEILGEGNIGIDGNIVISSFGKAKKINVIKAINNATGLGLVKSKELVDNLPATVPYSEELYNKLIELGVFTD